MITDTCGSAPICSEGGLFAFVVAIVILVCAVAVYLSRKYNAESFIEPDELLLLTRITNRDLRAKELRIGTQAKHLDEYARAGFRVVTAETAEVESQVRQVLNGIDWFDNYFGPRKDER
jgi:hypothetical protein